MYRGTRTVAVVERVPYICRYTEGHTQVFIYRKKHTFADINKDTHI